MTARVPERFYISMEGVLAHIHDHGWKEIKAGCVYTTRICRSRRRAGEHDIRAQQQSYVASLSDAATFGWPLWAEATRRELEQAEEVVVIGDGAHWIWRLAEEHFPGATQIVDYYHASEYVWNAATTIYGETSAERTVWAKQQLDYLWQGKLVEVLASLLCR